MLLSKCIENNKQFTEKPARKPSALTLYETGTGNMQNLLYPVGHFKIPQAGRADYQLTEGFCASRVAASLSLYGSRQNSEKIVR
jgi:hypothetical protein